MKLYSIFYRENRNYRPIFEGTDGNYWLGGNPKQLYPHALIFNTRKAANAALISVKHRIEVFDDMDSIFRQNMDSITVEEFEMVVNPTQ